MSFEEEIRSRIGDNGKNALLLEAGSEFMHQSIMACYSYNFSCLGRPIIQYPQDMIAMQELLWQVQPDLIIETGIAHGGSLILSASMLAMIDYCEAAKEGRALDPAASRRRVLGLDIDIRAHNRAAIEAHPLAHKIEMIQGSSIAPEIISRVHEYAKNYERIFVCLDSNHTHEHVLAELEAYAPLVSKKSYCVVFDTIIENMPDDMFPDRPWGKGNNPRTAVREYLRRLKLEGRKAADGAPLHFEIDKMIENKLLITVAPDGYLKRI
ncbi:cephalosporin hydroxylase family protein [Syntrophus aciditrophicus]|uniref:Cephalosporin hydroxylase n=1 Tax=Syntrophus aciditrophicus (strain SB) TaxID=56780 RepID=Q2LWP8_SYNAS|nr:cephalosporin hydroxylase family protein [Syntrophus aciditrophicus]ABC78505.1 putative cephalosporin hydroxylase [Syntrophus aciditrophicus SB]